MQFQLTERLSEAGAQIELRGALGIPVGLIRFFAPLP